MCTVTFFPLNKNDFILTSNRDEKIERITLPPNFYVEGEHKLLYPKDKIAGGTWIGVSDRKRLICVLNGGFKKHRRKDNYVKSRGVLAKELLITQNLSEHIKNMALNDVEPFTMIIVTWDKSMPVLLELVWDGDSKYFEELEWKEKIWSSSTLYSNLVKKDRQSWFNHWKENNEINQHSILEFHHSDKGDKTQAILMKRPSIQTVSITSVKKEKDQIEMIYEDVISNTKKQVVFT